MVTSELAVFVTPNYPYLRCDKNVAPTNKMGCGMSTEEKEGKARNEEIENQLKRDKMMQRNEIKMLLLGAPHNYLELAKIALITDSE